MRHQNQLQNISMLSEGIFAITFVKIKEHYEFLIHNEVRMFRKKNNFRKITKIVLLLRISACCFMPRKFICCFSISLHIIFFFR